MTDTTKVEFKLHAPPDGHTVDLTLRISRISNGWVIKAGGAPFFCATEDALKTAVDDLLTCAIADIHERASRP